jgi:hypothetical protein
MSIKSRFYIAYRNFCSLFGSIQPIKCSLGLLAIAAIIYVAWSTKIITSVVAALIVSTAGVAGMGWMTVDFAQTRYYFYPPYWTSSWSVVFIEEKDRRKVRRRWNIINTIATVISLILSLGGLAFAVYSA